MVNPYLLTFFVNTAVLVFEITTARIVAPHFGASTDVWSAIIATVIGGLSVGYYLGGIQADKGNVQAKISFALGAGGIFILLIGAFGELMLSVAATVINPGIFDVSSGGLIVVGMLFFVPPLLLGATYPLIVKSALIDMNNRGGRSIGLLSTAGALGSIVGALGAGLYLLPQFGSHAVIIGTGLLLVGLAIIHSPRPKALGVLGIGATTIVMLSMAASSVEGSVIADIDSAYNRIIVQDRVYGNITVRTVQTDVFGVQCSMLIEAGEPQDSVLVSTYLQTMYDIAAPYLARGTDALLIGGCNYSLPRVIAKGFPHMAVEVVEIDPIMTEVAKDFFAFDSNVYDITVTHEDGRIFLNGNDKLRDVIMLDAFGSSPYPPFHLTTREMFLRAYDLLTEDGIFVTNVIGGLNERSGKLTAATFATLADVFPEVHVYTTNEGDEDGIQNLIFVASRKKPDVVREGDVTNRVASLAESLKSEILTDDNAPVEWLARVPRSAQ